MKSVKIVPELIAPCGMNCGICMAYLREKNKCPGCRVIDINKSISVQKCKIKNCYELNKKNGDKILLLFLNSRARQAPRDSVKKWGKEENKSQETHRSQVRIGNDENDKRRKS